MTLVTQNVLTSPISLQPTGRYSEAPSGQLRCCPGCGIVLDHFVHRLPGAVPTGWRGGAEPKAPATAPAVAAGDGDIFVVKEERAPAIVIREQTPVIRRSAIAGSPSPLPAMGGRPTIIVGISDSLPRALETINAVLTTAEPSQRDLRILVRRDRVDPATVPESYADQCSLFFGENMADMLRSALWGSRPHAGSWAIWLSGGVRIKSGDWLEQLDATVGAQPPDSRVGLLGVKRRTVLTGADAERQARWFQIASWHNGRPMRNKQGQSAPNGNEIHYVAGHFWAANIQAMRSSGFPDERLTNEGISVCLGEQMYQNGWNTKMFDGDNRIIGLAPPVAGKRSPMPPWYGVS